MAKHHYVPQCYLRNFSVSRDPNRIYAYQRNRKPFLTTTKSIAAKNDFYIFVDQLTGKESDALEKVFSKLEDIVSHLIEKLNNTDFLKLTNREKSDLAEFIGYLHTRNLSFRQRTKNLQSEFMQLLMTIKAQHKEAFKEDIKKAGIKIESEKELEELRKFILSKNYEIEWKGGDDYFLRLSLELANAINPIIFYKEWHLIESNSSRVFITSDNPVSLIRPRKLPQFYGVGFINGIIVLPISPKRCFLLKDKKENKSVIKVGRRTVDFINIHTMFYAHKFIFSNIKSKDIQNMFNGTIEGESERVLIDH